MPIIPLTCFIKENKYANFIEWYKDEEIEIIFDKVPDVGVLYPYPTLNEETKKDICSKPFINETELEVVLIDKINDETYEFKIPKDYRWDGASIPRVFWRLIGAKTDSKFLIPSLIHDVLCENHSYIDNNRYLSTCVFERLLYVSGVNAFNRWMMKHSVDNYQKIFGGW